MGYIYVHIYYYTERDGEISAYMGRWVERGWESDRGREIERYRESHRERYRERHRGNMGV